jgi:hypothetical protein
MNLGNRRICTDIGAPAVKIGFSMTTAAALEAFGPTQPKQLFLTGFLGTKLFGIVAD